MFHAPQNTRDNVRSFQPASDLCIRGIRKNQCSNIRARDDWPPGPSTEAFTLHVCTSQTSDSRPRSRISSLTSLQLRCRAVVLVRRDFISVYQIERHYRRSRWLAGHGMRGRAALGSGHPLFRANSTRSWSQGQAIRIGCADVRATGTTYERTCVFLGSRQPATWGCPRVSLIFTTSPL